LLPAWVSPSDLDAERFYLPQVPRGQGDRLRSIAADYREAMRPSTHDQRKAALLELRLATVPRNESELEARASFAKLIDDLSDVPADIVHSACRAYANEPGTRFFPRGAGELRTFANPMMAQRAIRAHRLEEMARASDEVFDESTRCTPEEAAAIKAEFGLVTNPYPEQPKPVGTKPRMPTRDDYLALGVDPSVLNMLPAKGQAA